MARLQKKTTREEGNIPDPLPQELYTILACPVDKADVVYTADKTGLQCQKCKYIYPIRDGIPIMLPPEMQEKQ